MITGPQALPPGRGLDMGSGEGSKAIFMAQHGWPMTAVKNVPRAVAEAHRREPLDSPSACPHHHSHGDEVGFA